MKFGFEKAFHLGRIVCKKIRKGVVNLVTVILFTSTSLFASFGHAGESKLYFYEVGFNHCLELVTENKHFKIDSNGKYPAEIRGIRSGKDYALTFDLENKKARYFSTGSWKTTRLKSDRYPFKSDQEGHFDISIDGCNMSIGWRVVADSNKSIAASSQIDDAIFAAQDYDLAVQNIEGLLTPDKPEQLIPEWEIEEAVAPTVQVEFADKGRFLPEFSSDNVKPVFESFEADQRRSIQAELKLRGLYFSSVDGLYGPGTKGAIQKYLNVGDLSSVDSQFISTRLKRLVEEAGQKHSAVAGMTATASFDCRTELTPTEKAICQNREIGQLDKNLSDYYSKLRDELDEEKSTVVRNTQRAWINERNSCEAEVDCLLDVYVERISYLCTELTLIDSKISCQEGPKKRLIDGTDQKLSQINVDTTQLDLIDSDVDGISVKRAQISDTDADFQPDDNYLFSDLEEFVAISPDTLDSLKLASLYLPARRESSEGNRASKFQALKSFVLSSENFVAYAQKQSRLRELAYQQNINNKLAFVKTEIERLQDEIAKSPLSERALQLYSIVEKYSSVTDSLGGEAIISAASALRKEIEGLENNTQSKSSKLQKPEAVAVTAEPKSKNEPEIAQASTCENDPALCS
ncbi:MAG: DUF1311 domain-containing protein, partial [Oceanospirillaceae bacterium]|nr:DUF1311 domain-containing protein [Oceanospirillaceae bacterium]